MAAWLASNLATVLIITGLALLAIEVAVLGFSVFILFFFGLACIVTGLLTAIGVLPGTLAASFGSIAVFSLAFAFALWKPLKKMQDSGITNEVKGDFIGHSFVLDSDISATVTGSHRMSGVDWQVQSTTPLAAGTKVHVIKVEVGMLTVAAKGS
jgi:inner membrane protein